MTLTDLMGYLCSPEWVVVFTEVMASTIIEEKKSFSVPMIFEDIEVLAQFMRQSLPRSETFYDKCSSMYLHASLTANLYPDMMIVG